ncbi:hypothetical protein [Flindersiella endophytica]
MSGLRVVGLARSLAGVSGSVRAVAGGGDVVAVGFGARAAEVLP